MDLKNAEQRTKLKPTLYTTSVPLFFFVLLKLFNLKLLALFDNGLKLPSNDLPATPTLGTQWFPPENNHLAQHIDNQHQNSCICLSSMCNIFMNPTSQFFDRWTLKTLASIKNTFAMISYLILLWSEEPSTHTCVMYASLTLTAPYSTTCGYVKHTQSEDCLWDYK